MQRADVVTPRDAGVGVVGQGEALLGGEHGHDGVQPRVAALDLLEVGRHHLPRADLAGPDQAGQLAGAEEAELSRLHDRLALTARTGR